MSLPRENFGLSVAEYLDGERDAEVRHEYVSGQAYATAGASARHNRRALLRHLRVVVVGERHKIEAGALGLAASSTSAWRGAGRLMGLRDR